MSELRGSCRVYEAPWDLCRSRCHLGQTAVTPRPRWDTENKVCWGRRTSQPNMGEKERIFGLLIFSIEKSDVIKMCVQFKTLARPDAH